MAELVGPLGAVDIPSLFEAFERAATHAGLAVFVMDVRASPPRLIYASEMLAQLVGLPLEEVIGRAPWDFVAPEQRQRAIDTLASRGPGSPPITLEFEVERPDGTRRESEVGIARLMTSSAELSVCYVRDKTSESVAVEALRRSESRFRSLIERAPDGVVIIQHGRIVLANPVAVRLFGESDFEVVRGRPLSDYMPQEELARANLRINELLTGSVPDPTEYTLRNGVITEVLSVLYEFEGKPAILALVRDVTERRRMQEKLFHGDRLATIGTMAAAVAHEINNPLTFLQLNLQALERELATELDPARAARLREHIQSSMHGVDRISRIVQDLRVYSRDERTEVVTAVDVVAVAERALQMVAHDLRHRALLVRRYPDEPAIVNASEGRLEQVVINLLVNAIQALDGTGPGTNRITIEITVGDQITLTVSDTGAGVTNPDRVFEPFFTTKPAGEGTGLGLSVCKQLVERMRGRIEMKRVHRETKLIVTLPRSRDEVAQPPVIAESERSDRLRVLVIDDEDHVRSAIRNLLADDHDIDTVADGESALAALGESTYDVILCDVMMPRMNGREVYERVRAQWPGLERRIVFVTGGAFLPLLATFLDSVDNLKLHKPFTAENVLSLLREAQRRATASA